MIKAIVFILLITIGHNSFGQNFSHPISTTICDFNFLSSAHEHQNISGVDFYAQKIADSVYLKVVIIDSISIHTDNAPAHFPQNKEELIDLYLADLYAKCR